MKISLYKIDLAKGLLLPYYEDGIKAGFPSPANDYFLPSIDLIKLLIKNPESTFLARVDGDSMVNAGINDKDILIIDRSLQPINNDKLLCVFDGEFTIKFVKIEKDKKTKQERAWLIPANDEFPAIEIPEDSELLVWGVITSSIKIHRTVS